jgi:hypothetical protein
MPLPTRPRPMARRGAAAVGPILITCAEYSRPWWITLPLPRGPALNPRRAGPLLWLDPVPSRARRARTVDQRHIVHPPRPAVVGHGRFAQATYPREPITCR